MSILDKLAAIYAPYCCLGCGVEGGLLLCEQCQVGVARVPSRCYRCRAASRNYTVCPNCKKYSALQSVYVWAHYDDLPKDLISLSKYERARGGLIEIGSLLSEIIDPSDFDVIVPLPTASARARVRGYDQSVVIARQVSRATSLELKSALSRINQAHQVGANRLARYAHMRGAFIVRRSDFVKNRRVLLIDDVCTTGASIESAAKVLKKAGAKTVSALVFAQPS